MKCLRCNQHVAISSKPILGYHRLVDFDNSTQCAGLSKAHTIDSETIAFEEATKDTNCPNCGSEDYTIRQHSPSPTNGGFDGTSTYCHDCGYEDVG